MTEATTPSNIRVFPTLEELSRKAAERFLELTVQHAAAKRRFCVALSGGSTPKRLYGLLGSHCFADRILWHDVHLFQVDERSVPPGDAESNYRMICEALLDQAPIPPGNFHRLAAESPDRDGAARDYAAEIARVLSPPPGAFPRFDLIFLGLGPDGHTASLFPGSDALGEQKLWVRPNWVEKFKMDRLTLTYPVLNAAAEVIFLVAGKDKAEILRQILGQPAGAETYPAQRVRPVNGQLRWFVDEAAARLL